MKAKTKLLPVLALSLAWAGVGIAQKASPAPASAVSSAAASSAKAPSPQDDLKQVLAKMNQAATSFKSAQADFEFDNFTKDFDEHDIQKGQIYFRRAGKEVDVAIHVVWKVTKFVLYKEGKISLYEPAINQVTEKIVGKNKSDVEAVMNLGFGGSGDELVKSFDVTMEGWETVDGVKTARLRLIGKSEDLKKLFKSAVLWIDPERDVPLKQQFFASVGDYRLNHYTGIKLNAKLGNDLFQLKTKPNTQIVRP